MFDDSSYFKHVVDLGSLERCLRQLKLKDLYDAVALQSDTSLSVSELQKHCSNIVANGQYPHWGRFKRVDANQGWERFNRITQDWKLVAGTATMILGNPQHRAYYDGWLQAKNKNKSDADASRILLSTFLAGAAIVLNITASGIEKNAFKTTVDPLQPNSTEASCIKTVLYQNPASGKDPMLARTLLSRCLPPEKGYPLLQELRKSDQYGFLGNTLLVTAVLIFGNTVIQQAQRFDTWINGWDNKQPR